MPLENADGVLAEVYGGNAVNAGERLALDGVELGVLEVDGVEALELLKYRGGHVIDATVALDLESQLSYVHLRVEVSPDRIAQNESLEYETVDLLGAGEFVVVAVAVQRRVVLIYVAYVYVLLLSVLAILGKLLAVLVVRARRVDRQVNDYDREPEEAGLQATHRESEK